MALTTGAQAPRLTEDLVLKALSTVQEPELGGDLVSRRMIKQIVIEGDQLRFTIELTTPACPLKDQIQAECEQALASIAGIPLYDGDVERDLRAASFSTVESTRLVPTEPFVGVRAR